jgi:hypothetical protein
MEMYHLMKFHNAEIDVPSGGLETFPGALKFLMEMFLLIVTGSS